MTSVTLESDKHCEITLIFKVEQHYIATIIFFARIVVITMMRYRAKRVQSRRRSSCNGYMRINIEGDNGLLMRTIIEKGRSRRHISTFTRFWLFRGVLDTIISSRCLMLTLILLVVMILLGGLPTCLHDADLVHTLFWPR